MRERLAEDRVRFRSLTNVRPVAVRLHGRSVRRTNQNERRSIMTNVLVSIPLSNLRRSKLNVRKTEPLNEIDQLAASIKSKGLLENLVVRPLSEGKGETFEIIAGSRRFAALKLLAKRKQVSRDHPVSCLLLSSR